MKEGTKEQQTHPGTIEEDNEVFDYLVLFDVASSPTFSLKIGFFDEFGWFRFAFINFIKENSHSR